MKKLLLKLTALSLFATPVASLISCSSAVSAPTLSGEVTFEKTDYAVLKGESVSVAISNFSEISQKKFADHISVQTSDSSIATYINGQSDDNSSVSVQGLKSGVTTITVSYTNLSTQQLMRGSFQIHVLDFSSTKVDWDGTTKDTALDIYESGAYLVFGKIDNFADFKNSSIGYDYTSGFTATLTEITNKLTNFVESTGTVNANGEVCFKIKNLGKSENSWVHNEDGSNITVTVTNENLGIKDSSNSEYVKDFDGSAPVKATTHDLNFNNPMPSTPDDMQAIKNDDGTYTLTYALIDNDGNPIDLTGFSDASTIEINSKNISLVTSNIVDNQHYRIRIRLDSQIAFSSFSISILFAFNKPDGGDNEIKKYAGVLSQGFTDYLVPNDDTDAKSISDIKVVNSPDKYTVNTSSYSPIDISTTLSSTGENLLKNYTYSSWLVVADDDDFLNKLNPDPKNLDESGQITQSGIDNANNIATGKLSFDVNNITINGTNVEIVGSGAVRNSNITSATAVLIFKDSGGNITAGCFGFSFNAVDSINYSSFIDTSPIARANEIYDDSLPDKPINIHDGLTPSTGLEMYIKDRTIKLKIGQVNGGSSDIDYSKWTVQSSNESYIKSGRNLIDKDGNVTLTLVGQGQTLKRNTSLKLTFDNPDDPNDKITQTLYTSAFIGKEVGSFDISRILRLGYYYGNTTISNSLRTSSIFTMIAYGCPIEFNDDITSLRIDSTKPIISLNGDDYQTSMAYVVFDTDVYATAPCIVCTGAFSGITRKIIFNGDVNFQAQTSGTSAIGNFCGIVDVFSFDPKPDYLWGITFNGDVNVNTITKDSGETAKFALGVIAAGPTSNLGKIFFNKSVKVDSSNWAKGSQSTGLIVTATNQYSSSTINSYFELYANSVDIEGTNSKTKALIDDYAGSIETSDFLSKTIINVDKLTLGKSDVGANDSNGYGNAIYSRINGTDGNRLTRYARLGAISVNDYYDLDVSEDSNDSNASIIKFKGQYYLDNGSTMGTIKVGDKDPVEIQKLLGSSEGDSLPLKIIKLSDL